MEENTKNSGQGLGVAALIVGIISFVVAIIPCVGLLAVFTSFVAIILGAIGLSQASRDNSPKGLNMGGLILGIVALFIAIAQIVFFAGFADKASFIEEKIEDIFDDIETDVLNEFEDGSFSITIDDGEDKIEIKSSIKRDLIDKLEELEDPDSDIDKDTSVNVSVKIDTSGGE